MKIVNDIPAPVKKGTLVAMDVEMFGQDKDKLHRPTGTFACLSICSDPKTVYQIYDDKQMPDVLKAMKDGTWVFHNALYDLRQMRRYATIAPRTIWDTMLVERSAYGGYYQNFSLADLTRRWLGIRMIKEVRSEFEDATTMTKDMKQYAANDAVRTLEIARKQMVLSMQVYFNEDEPMIFPLLDMPGIPVDTDGWKAMASTFEQRGKELEAELGFNVYSQRQVLSALRARGLHLIDTRAETLKELEEHDTVKKVLEARMYRKASSTYGVKWVDKNVEADGLVYSSYHITGAETGRMSSSSPNMQQIPSRTLPEYRKMFKAQPGYVIMVSDVSQQEPRILAYESKDAELLAVLERGESTHLAVARAIFHDDTITKADTEKYMIGKTVNLGTAYGLSEYGLAVRLHITEQEAATFLTDYFHKFKDVLVWINKMRKDAYLKGYVTTASGRRIYINRYDHQWQNNAINAPIQGGAAGNTKTWVHGIWKRCLAQSLPYSVVGIVHDEVVQHVPREMVKTYRTLTEAAFQDSSTKLFPGVPFVVETEFGKSWACKNMKEELLFDEEAE